VQALHTQIRVIRALVLRETRTRFGQHRLGYVWALIEPATMIATFATMYFLAGRTAKGSIPILPFLTTGFLTYGLFSTTTRQCVNAINGNKGLLFYPDIRPLDLVAARVLLETVTTFVVFAVMMGGVALWEGRLRIDNILTTLLGLLLASGLGAGLGLVLCGLTTFSNVVDRIHGPLFKPLFWISVLFFSTNDLPSNVRDIFIWNPILHAVELTRTGWFPGYDIPQVNALYPAAWIMVLLFFGLTLERVARRRLELT